MMFCVHLIGGYSGDLGSVTAAKDVELPFVPTNGMLLDMNLGLTKIWDDEIIWEMRDGKKLGFTAHVDDFGESEQITTLESWVQTLKADGWEILEIEEMVPAN